VRISVQVGQHRVSAAQGIWVRPGVVLTTLDAVNTVPPTGELVVHTQEGDFPASLWVGGNPSDTNIALLYVHPVRPFGALHALPARPMCSQTPPLETLRAPDARPAADALGATDTLTGTPLFAPSGCVGGLIAVLPGQLPALVPADALARLKAPDESAATP
jgi:hypothetical protein